MKKKITTLTLSGIIAILVMACGFASVTTPTSEATDPEIIPVTGDTSTPSGEQAIAPTQTPTVNSDVIITAATGSLSIRRGPGTSYNLLSYLQDGQSAVATARDNVGDWLYIALPSSPALFGWVSAGTQYSTIQGDILSLEVKTVAAADPIIIRNCTYHPMKITPLNIVLAPQNEAPNNKTVVFPGDYAAYDQSEVGPSPVFTASLSEGDYVDINIDGFGNMYYCP